MFITLVIAEVITLLYSFFQSQDWILRGLLIVVLILSFLLPVYDDDIDWLGNDKIPK